MAALALAAVSTWLLTRAVPTPEAAPSHQALSQTLVLDFHGYRFGVPPTEFRYDPTGTGPFDRPTWRVFTDPTAPSPPLALVQSPAAGDPDSALLAVLRGVQTRDLDASVGLKPMGGTQSSAGLAWHVHGRTSFYAAIADARKERLEVIAVSDARSTVLASVPIPIAIEFERSSPSPSHGWFALRVRSTGQRITVWFEVDGQARRACKTAGPEQV